MFIDFLFNHVFKLLEIYVFDRNNFCKIHKDFNHMPRQIYGGIDVNESCELQLFFPFQCEMLIYS